MLHRAVLDELKKLGEARANLKNKLRGTLVIGDEDAAQGNAAQLENAAQEEIEDKEEKKINPLPMQNAQIARPSFVEQKSGQEEKGEDNEEKSEVPENPRQSKVKDIKQPEDKPSVKIDRDKFILQQKDDLNAFIAKLEAKQDAAFKAFIETSTQKEVLLAFHTKQSAERKVAHDNYMAQQAAELDAFDESQRYNIKKDKDEEKIILPLLQKEDFFCSITRQPIIYPSVVSPCGHLFEKNAIEGWIGEKKDADCPLCRTKIQEAHPPVIQIFSKLHKDFLFLNPRLTFSLALLNDCLKESIELKENKQLRVIIDLLKKSPDLLNAVSDEEGFEGCTAVTILAGNPIGLKILKDLRKNIQPKGLNAIGYYGLSAVSHLIADLKNMDVVDSDICGKINSDALNAIITSRGKPCDGATPVTYLAWRFSENIGRNLLDEFPVLFDLIRPEGLNAISNDGDSALYWLAKSIEKHKFFTAEILNMISEEAFNTRRPDGTSPIYFFTYFEKGRQLLLAHSKLCALISKEALFTEPQPLQVGLYDIKKKTPAYWLEHTITGQKILARNPDLQKKIDYSFNLKKLDDLLSPCINEEGKESKDQKELNLMIAFLQESKETMNLKDKNYYELTAIHILASHEKGLEQLLTNRELRDMIGSDGLNAICETKQNAYSSHWFKTKEITYYGLSAVYCLMKSKIGRQILLADNARLFSLITPEAFYRAIPEGPDQGKTPYSWLKESPELEALFKQRADLQLKTVKP